MHKIHRDIQSVNSLQGLRGQGEVGSDLSVKTREEEGSSNVGEESNGGLGHGKYGALGSNSERSVDGESNSSSHGDSVHESNVGLRVGSDEVVDLVFVAEKVYRLLVSSLLVVDGKRSYISSGTEGLLSGAFHDDDVGQL